MVEGVNNIQTQSIQKKDNAGRNAAIAGAVGAIGGGTAGYLTKQIIKDGEIKDEFVKEAKKQVINILGEDKADRKILKALYNMEDNPAIDTVKKFLKQNKKFIEKIDDIKVADLLKKPDNEIMDYFNQINKAFSKALKIKFNDLPELMKSWLEKGQKTFKPVESLKDNKMYKGVLKAQQKIKGKAGLIWGAATGAVLSIGTFIASKVGGNKQV